MARALLWNVGRFPGVVGFSFSGLIFSCILSEAFEGRLPRPGGVVDGKFYGFCLLTNLKETNEFETKLRQVL